MQASIHVSREPSVQYLLRIGDTCLIHAQRLAEWCGHAPMLEEDIALSNMALDLVGQARAVLTRAGKLEAELGGAPHDEDQLAFLRDERDFRNLTLAELPRGDFAVTMLRNFALATFLKLLWTKLERSSDAELAGIAGKALKEARYHQEHAADWVVRLGDGTAESAARMKAALDGLWPYFAEIFESDEIDEQAAGLGPRPALGRPARRLARRVRRRHRRRRPGAAGRAAVPQHRQVGPAQRAPRLHPGRDAAPAARLSRRRVVSLAAVGSRLEQAWAVLDRVLDPEVPVVSVRDLGIVRDVLESDERPDRRRHADLLRLPGDRGDRGEHRRRARGRGPRPGAGRDAPRAGLDHRLDEREGPAPAARLRHRAARPGGRAGDGAAALRAAAAADGAGLPALREPADRAALRVRRHRLQGALALPRLRRAVRALQADLRTTSRP